LEKIIKMKAVFKIVENNNSYILIEDLANQLNTMSITNDAEDVIKYLTEKYNIQNKVIYYIDTDNRVDILEHDNFGNFTGFKPGYETIKEFLKS